MVPGEALDIAPRIIDVVLHTCRPCQRVGRNPQPPAGKRGGPADAIGLLDQQDVQAGKSRGHRRGHASRPGTDHEHVTDVPFGAWVTGMGR